MGTPVPVEDLPPELRPKAPVPIWDVPPQFRKGLPMPNGNGVHHGTPEDDAIVNAFDPSHSSAAYHALDTGVRTAINAPDIVGEHAGNYVMDKTNSPALATLARVVPDAAAMLLGGGEAAIGRAGKGLAEGGEVIPGLLSDAERAGFRTQKSHPIASNIAGESGQAALTTHNNAVADRIAANEANVAPGVDMSYDALKEGRKAPGAVYDRAVTDLGSGHMLADDPTFASAVDSAAGPRRITKGTPDAEAKIAALKQQILSPQPRDGEELVNELRGLRQEGSKNLGSDDVSNQQLGTAQINIANALEDYVGRNLPANGSTNLAQFQAARQQIAKNYAVEGALRGSSVDPQAIARLQRNDSGLLTDGLKTVADFANENPAITGLASRIYNPPSIVSDLAGRSAYQAGRNVESVLSPDWLMGALGAKAAARRVLTGSTPRAVQAANDAFRAPLADLFEPLTHTPPPANMPPKPLYLPAPDAIPTPSGAISTENQLADIGLTPDVRAAQQNHPGLANSSPPVPPAPRSMPTVEFNPTGDYSGVLQPNGAPGAARPGYPQLGDVLSQGVPEGIVQRTAAPASAGGPAPLAFAPGQVPGSSPFANPGTLQTLGDQFVDVYHGGAGPITKFDPAKVGAGEGNASFGNGAGGYHAESPDVARTYAEQYGGYITQSKIKKAVTQNMLDWDKPLREQPGALEKLGVDPDAPVRLNGIDPDWSGQELHDALARGKTNVGAEPSKQGASNFLSGKGFKGVTYLDGKSRNAGGGTRNYAVFDPADVEVQSSKPLGEAFPAKTGAE